VSTVFQQQVDPNSNPDLANELARKLTEPSAESQPLLVAPPPNFISLPGGYLDADGQLHREVRIREITGSDEETLARELRNPNFTIPKIVDLLLRHTVQAVGTIEPVTPTVLNQMLVGDRSMILLGVRILTFGSDWEVPDFPCRLCGRPFGVIIELESDIKVRRLEDPYQQEITVPLRNGHEATVAYLTGAVQLEMVGDGTRTPPEEQTIAIDRCLRTIDGVPVTTPVSRSMSMADRHKIIDALAGNQPGPLLEEVSVQCSNCGQTADYAMSLVDLFR
jgi:hypothetical protein